MPQDEYGPATYGDRIAEVYDEWHAVPTDTDEAVDFLAGLAEEGPALELGIGTGRIALPLAARGVDATGSTPRRRWWPGSARSLGGRTYA